MKAERAMVFDGTNFEEIKRWCDRHDWMSLVEENGKKRIAFKQRYGQIRYADVNDYVIETFFEDNKPLPLACRAEQLEDYYPNIKVINAKQGIGHEN